MILKLLSNLLRLKYLDLKHVSVSLNMMSNQPCSESIEVTKLVNGGYGLAYYHKRPLFIPKTVPGDHVQVLLTRKKKYYSFAKVICYTKKSPLRQLDTCIHSNECGGCQFQDIDYSNQLNLKQDCLHDTITHDAPFLLPYLKPIIPCKTTHYHRNKMEFAFYQSESLELGLKEQLNPTSVIPVSQCLLMSETSNDILNFTRNFFENSKLSVWNSRKQMGCLSHLMIRHSKAFDTYMVNILASSYEPLFSNYALSLSQQFPQIKSINLLKFIQKKGIPSSTSCHHLHGDSFIFETINNLTFRISPLSFFQTNSLQVGTLYDIIKDSCSLEPGQTLLDLYCGTGTIGQYVSQGKYNLIGIDEISEAIEDAKENARFNNIDNTTYFSGRVKNILKFNSFSPDCVIIDPPRSGMVPKALKRVCELNCKQLVYVSCNPVSLVRDLKLLRDYGYHVTNFTPVDMFPHTYHLECVVSLTLN
ncbi:23S rRNA (uracil(1939)-C(5))-methyltransferase RlmD [bacterium]|nr:23S rRNA (uracil(1939)-C(5))-methyltransferase RlmD [bacterium]